MLPWLTPGAEAAATADRTVTVAEPQAYVVFFGLDLFVKDGARLRPIADISGNNVLVLDEDGTTPVPLHDVQLTAEMAPKLSRTGATIADLEGAPVYSARANPIAQGHAQQMMVEGVQDHTREQADIELRNANEYLSQAMGSEDPRALVDAQQRMNAATTNLDAVHSTPTLRGALPGSGGDDTGHDGFEISFRASAPEPHENAYGVVRLIIRAPQQPEATLQTLKLFRLRELTPKPRRTVVRIFNVPPGFTVESYQVHVYAGGGELATNLSANRVELTVDEAHQYLIMRHTHLNPGATLPAQVLVDLARPAAPPELVAGQENMLVHLGITAAGRVDQVRGDAAISAALLSQLEAALREVRFLPALVDGQPAASTGTFALSELFSRNSI